MRTTRTQDSKDRNRCTRWAGPVGPTARQDTRSSHHERHDHHLGEADHRPRPRGLRGLVELERLGHAFGVLATPSSQPRTRCAGSRATPSTAQRARQHRRAIVIAGHSYGGVVMSHAATATRTSPPHLRRELPRRAGETLAELVTKFRGRARQCGAAGPVPDAGWWRGAGAVHRPGAVRSAVRRRRG